ncbi:formate dehydrogenase accessory sulfurtransferase FdhD [Corynebacterium guangdongense]|uniref:Sulfur carrier protein FdhD n=1 Tax=Corynebacterium guangdongense TaxID=1783348 RepID=A0ABU1ZUC4_9CORY|nr:formate dehydrogenase accessory sulfurtransferase FdhD [Corynebacterium guangdongense]MDR7328531.1 FdhD protein [Corynebacterium guangdongense]WJZ17108.1 formate dehydrogenase accessory protein [Corynebacterium guangdongense]
MGRIGQSYRVTKVTFDGGPDGRWTTDTRGDTVTVEEPLELRVNGTTITTTMRTPGNDVELVHGFLHGEGHITSASQVAEARYCAGATGPNGENTYNLIETDLAVGVTPPGLEAIRLTTTSSACGVCGSTSIDEVMGRTHHPIEPVTLDPRMIVGLPEKLRAEQKQFRRTGGIHAAGAFTLSGEPVVIREDVGRHNAADKVIGHLLMNDLLPAKDLILVMSSRASYELVQKAIMAGFPALVAVSAPSSLAVDLAREAGLSLVGFTRDDRFNLYSGQLAEA